MASSDDPDEQSESDVADASHDGQLRGRFRRDPFILLLAAAVRVPTLLNALHARLSKLPGWIQLSTGVATSVLSIYFARTIRTATDELVAGTVEPVVRRFVGISFGTSIVILLLFGVSFQVAVVNARLAGLTCADGRKLETNGGEIVENMENDAVTDGGQGNARDDADHVGICWNGVLTGIVFGIGLGSVFGVDGVTGGAVFGAFVGDWVERYVIRSRRRG